MRSYTLNHGYNLVASVSVREEYKLMARKPFTMQSNLSKIQEKIKEKPQKALGVIGQNLVKETKPNINTKGKGPMPFLKPRCHPGLDVKKETL